MFSRNLAFIIGINDYNNGISPLQNAVNDAKKLVEILRQEHGYQVWVCLNEIATLKNLNKLLETTLPQEVTKDDRLLFYFAGHGIALNGDDGPQGYLIPHDAKLGDVQTYLSMSKLQACLSQLPCRHFLGILDCCFAGAFRWSTTRDLSTIPEVIHKERYDRFINDAAWQVITSAAYDQRALDAFNFNTERGAKGNHSPFAAALIAALGGEADIFPPAQFNQPAGDGVITATELYLYLRDAVEPATEGYRHRQTPGIWPLQKHDKGEYVFLTPGHILNLPPAPPLDESQNPYRGLQSFEEEHSHLFFGRLALTQRLHEFVSQQPLTVVLGASGTGKSSLVKAGLIPYLKQLPGKSNHQHWYILPTLRPGEFPLKALCNTLAQADWVNNSHNTNNNIPSQMMESAINKIAAGSQKYPEAKLLLLIDQLEEVITLCQDDQERKNFLEFLARAVAEYPNYITIVITLRSDFEPQFQDCPLQPYWTNARFIVPQMTRGELRQVIEEPAIKRVMYFQSNNSEYPLIDQLIDEVADMPGALPLLSFTLSELYIKYLHRQRMAQLRGETIDRAMQQADYQELGGVARSLTQRANQEYEQLVQEDPSLSEIIPNVMLRMVAVGGELARRRVPLSELEYPPSQNQRITEIIQRFCAARLLVQGQDSEGKPYVEPAHDALVRGWQRLLVWRQQQEESLIIQRRLTPAAEEWKTVKSQVKSSSLPGKIENLINWLDHRFYIAESLVSQFNHWLRQKQNQQQNSSNPVEFLWTNNPYLHVLNKKMQSNDHGFNLLEIEFIQQSVLQKRRNISWRWRMAIAVILGLSGLTIWALYNLRVATTNEIQTEIESAAGNLRSNQLILDALLNSLRAGKSLKDNLLFQGIFQPEEKLKSEVIRTLRKAVYTVKESNRLLGFTSRVKKIFWLGEKIIIATSERDGSIRLLDRQGKVLPNGMLPGNQNAVKEVIFSPDGSKIAIGGEDGTIRLWDWQNNQKPLAWKAHQGEVTNIRFSANGKQIVSVGNTEGTAYRWDLSGKQLQIFKLPQNRAIATGFCPDGQPLIVTTVNTGNNQEKIRILNLSAKELKTSPIFKSSIDSVILSPDCRQLFISYGSSRSIGFRSILWNWQTGNSTELGDDSIASFSKDGTKVATSGFNNGAVRLWDLDGNQILDLKGHVSDIVSINFKANGREIATASVDGTVRVWSIKNQQLNPFKPFPQLSGLVKTLCFSQDGKRLLTQAEDGTIRLLDLSGHQLAVFKSQYGIFQSLSFSPNGQQIATLDQQGTVRLLDLSGKQILISQKQYNTNSNLSFSPDGKHLAVMGTDEKIYKLDLLSGKDEYIFNGIEEGEGFNRQLIWKPDNKILMTAVNQLGRLARGVRFLDLQLDQWFATRFSPREISSISFNLDGSLIAIAQVDGNVSLWDSEGNNLAEFTANKGVISNINLSPDGSILATIAEDGTAQLWQIGKLDELLVKACDRLNKYLVNPKTSESDRHLCNPITNKK